MKAGEHLICPRCGEETLLRAGRKPGENFGSFVEILSCSLCGAELGTPDAETSESEAAESRTDALAALLGESRTTVTLEKGDGFRRDCRNCREFVAHPFRAICSRTGKDVDPMGDCPYFSLAETGEKPKRE